jgi:hypothetical protein
VRRESGARSQKPGARILGVRIQGIEIQEAEFSRVRNPGVRIFRNQNFSGSVIRQKKETGELVLAGFFFLWD